MQQSNPNKIINVVSFHPDGTVEYTRSNLLTLFGGLGEMQRVTEIEKLPHANKFTIRWLRGPFAGAVHTRTIARNYLIPEELDIAGCPRFSPEYMRADDPMEFDTYNDAVFHEIAMLNVMRKAGVKFGEQTV